MSKYVNLFVAIVAALIFISAPVLADTMSIDTKNLTPELLAQVLKAQEKSSASIITPQAAAEWADMGKNIGVALSEAAKAMSVGVNDFATTFVGKLTIVLIVWKVLGQDMWSIFGGTAFWITLTSILSWSYRRHHFTYPVTVPATDRVAEHTDYKTRVDLDHDEKAVSMWVHLILFVLSTIVCAFIIF